MVDLIGVNLCSIFRQLLCEITMTACRHRVNLFLRRLIVLLVAFPQGFPGAIVARNHEVDSVSSSYSRVEFMAVVRWWATSIDTRCEELCLLGDREAEHYSAGGHIPTGILISICKHQDSVATDASRCATVCFNIVHVELHAGRPGPKSLG